MGGFRGEGVTPRCHRGGMIFTTRCAGCQARGPVLCRTCRFALVARPAPGAPGGIVVATAYSGRVATYCSASSTTTGDSSPPTSLESCRTARREAAGVDVVTWAPTSGSRRRRRGFDQAELIARGVAAHLGLPCRRLLERDGASRAADRAQPPPAPVRPALPRPPSRGRAPGARRRRRRHHRGDARRGGPFAASRWCHPRRARRRRGDTRLPAAGDTRPSIAAVARWGRPNVPRGPEPHEWTTSDRPPPAAGAPKSSRRARTVAAVAGLLSLAVCGAVAQASTEPGAGADEGGLSKAAAAAPTSTVAAEEDLVPPGRPRR